MLADLLRRARGREIELVVDYLSGVLPQGRIGVGWSMLQRAESGGAGAAAVPSLALVEVDAAFERLRSIAGAGSQEARIRELAALLARATADERSFLVRLLGRRAAPGRSRRRDGGGDHRGFRPAQAAGAARDHGRGRGR